MDEIKTFFSPSWSVSRDPQAKSNDIELCAILCSTTRQCEIASICLFFALLCCRCRVCSFSFSCDFSCCLFCCPQTCTFIIFISHLTTEIAQHRRPTSCVYRGKKCAQCSQSWENWKWNVGLPVSQGANTRSQLYADCFHVPISHPRSRNRWCISLTVRIFLFSDKSIRVECVYFRTVKKREILYRLFSLQTSNDGVAQRWHRIHHHQSGEKTKKWPSARENIESFRWITQFSFFTQSDRSIVRCYLAIWRRKRNRTMVSLNE